MELITDILRKEGWEDGREEGLEKGLEKSRETLLVLFPQKLGPTPPEIEAAIHELKDLDRIHDILARFLEIKDWREMEKLLNGQKN